MKRTPTTPWQWRADSECRRILQYVEYQRNICGSAPWRCRTDKPWPGPGKGKKYHHLQPWPTLIMDSNLEAISGSNLEAGPGDSAARAWDRDTVRPRGPGPGRALMPRPGGAPGPARWRPVTRTVAVRRGGLERMDKQWPGNEKQNIMLNRVERTFDSTVTSGFDGRDWAVAPMVISSLRQSRRAGDTRGGPGRRTRDSTWRWQWPGTEIEIRDRRTPNIGRPRATVEARAGRDSLSYRSTAPGGHGRHGPGRQAGGHPIWNLALLWYHSFPMIS
jgi:hypothetical protein